MTVPNFPFDMLNCHKMVFHAVSDTIAAGMKTTKHKNLFIPYATLSALFEEIDNWDSNTFTCDQYDVWVRTINDELARFDYGDYVSRHSILSIIETLLITFSELSNETCHDDMITSEARKVALREIEQVLRSTFREFNIT